MVNIEHRPRAVLVSYALQGHLNPSVHLAINLASRSFTMTFINTLPMHSQLTSTVGGGGEGDIFSIARQSGLDIRYVNVSDGFSLRFNRSLHHDQLMAALLHVFSAYVEETINEIVINGQPAVNWLIADTYFVWPGNMAKKFGLVFVFWTEVALIFTLYYHIDLLRFNGHFGCIDIREDKINYILGVKSIELKDLTSYLQQMDTTLVCHQIIYQAFKDAKNADFVLCNTAQELKPETISALQEKIPFFTVGPLFSTGFDKIRVSMSLWAESNCSHWLDSKPLGSIFNVDFFGLLRPDIVSSGEENLLPDAFREAILDRGMIVLWCWQIEVLAHSAIKYKVRLTKDEVAKKISQLMVGKTRDDGRLAIKKVKIIFEKALAADGSPDKNIGHFLKEIGDKIRQKR
ncbi:7-deoxyloganetin glucosyltransferase [Handroanthus impetiginosus]|uniref:7-deoxyloganetin glucosyltransferase n=1 Tax=Handroanthus impetiginosus TaxID=429701 RepID=A0A2G9H513_9LAMI|nr:7-deoxyloganetin glucosyltransferase [Handroanthus impetiginosus]